MTTRINPNFLALSTPVSCVIAILAILVVFCIAPFGVYIAFFAKQQPLPLYESSWVEKICQIFKIEANDEFCVNHSQQNARTFEALLQRQFPIGATSRDKIMSLVEIRYTEPSYDILAELGNSVVGFCPVPKEISETIYSCSILFSFPVNQLTIHFDAEGRVGSYVVWQPGS